MIDTLNFRPQISLDFAKKIEIITYLGSFNEIKKFIFKNLKKNINLDFITKKEGTGKIKLGSQDLKKIWKMKQTKLSSRYTTELKEIIALK